MMSSELENVFGSMLVGKVSAFHTTVFCLLGVMG